MMRLFDLEDIHARYNKILEQKQKSVSEITSLIKKLALREPID